MQSVLSNSLNYRRIQHASTTNGAHAYSSTYTDPKTGEKKYSAMIPVRANASGHTVLAQGIGATPRAAYRKAHRKSRQLRNDFIRIILARWAYSQLIEWAAFRNGVLNGNANKVKWFIEL